MNKKISIIIPCYNEEKYIASCIDSVLQSDINYEDLELFLVDGMSSDGTREIIKRYTQQYPFIKLLDNLKRVAPSAMNIGIRSAKGEYIVRLDAHASYPKNYISKLLYWHKKLDAENVGGVVITQVKNKSAVSNAIKNVLSDKLGVGSAFRSGVNEVKEVDTVPFGCYKKDVFEKYGLYNESLVRNQDIELNKRIKNSGGKIFIVPEITCTYFARESFRELVKNNFANGKWNILTAYFTKTFSSLSLRHFIPLLFVLGFMMLAFFSFISPIFFYLFIALYGTYFVIILLRSFQIKKDTTLVYQMLAFILLHFSYGFGSLVGISELPYIILKGKK